MPIPLSLSKWNPGVCLLRSEGWSIHSPPLREVIFKRLDIIHEVSPVSSPLESNDARTDGLLNHLVPFVCVSSIWWPQTLKKWLCWADPRANELQASMCQLAWAIMTSCVAQVAMWPSLIHVPARNVSTLTRDPMPYIITSVLYLSASLSCWMSLSKALSLHLLHCQHTIAHAYLADQ